MALDPTVPRWATDPGALVVTPPSGAQDNGSVPLQQIPAQFFNWLHLQIYLWIVYLRGFAFGMLRWAEYAECDTWVVGGSDFDLRLGRVDLIRFNGCLLNAAATTLHLANVEGAPSALTPNTWYYVYATPNVGLTAVTYQISATAPTGIWKMGAVGTHRYMGVSFVTDSQTGIPGFAFPIGSPIPFVRNGRRTRYFVNGDTRPSLETTVAAPFPVSITGLPLTNVISPLTARGVTLGVVSRRTSGATAAKVFINGTVAAWLGASGDRQASAFETPCGLSRAIDYYAEDVNVEATITVLGFEETNGEG